MGRRTLDIALSALGLLLVAPVLALAGVTVLLQGGRRPFSVGTRIGRNGHSFRVIELHPIKAGVLSSTRLARLYHLWNVLAGDMTLVGPSPGVPEKAGENTEAEDFLLAVKPGLTDMASIVFADERRILAGCADPARDYDRLIRPWKSRLGILYIQNRTTTLDMQLIALAVAAMVSRERALGGIAKVLADIGAPEEARMVASRPLDLMPPAPARTEQPDAATGLYGNQAVA